MALVAEKLRLLMSLVAFKALRAFDMRVMRIDVEVGRLFRHLGHRPVAGFAFRRLHVRFGRRCIVAALALKTARHGGLQDLAQRRFLQRGTRAPSRSLRA